jgi:hypothetical protein
MCIAFIGFIALFGATVQAQQPQDTSPCVRAESKLFLPLVGNWTIQWTDRTEPGKYAQSTARASIERDSTGCTLVEHFFGERGGRRFTALALLSFGNVEELQRVWLDSDHGQFLHFTGSRDGEVIRFQWQRDLGDRRLMLKHEYRAIQADSFNTETHLSTDGGKTWDVVQAAKYKRRR